MKLPKIYEPDQYESDIYALWEKSEAFVPKSRGSDQTYSIVVPPPNANGDLHLGHGLTLGIEDIAVRYHRMKGKKTLLLPGADHAGFETWVVYEKRLAKEGKSRFDFTREELYGQIWDFVAQNKENYESQFRRLGASVDWSRYVYTLDDKIVQQAYDSFGKMFKEGLIYRAEKLVNFCTFHGTGFADIEVAYQEVKGSLWHIRYPLTDGSGEVVVATTRPETMLGDVAVAVHPEDSRYKDFVGKTVKLPLTNREIPIIADEFVDKEFGTGAVKITPAHDPNDFEAGQRHDLPMISVIGHDGKITHQAPEPYHGLDVKAARQAVVKDLEEQDFLVKTEDHMHNVGHCYKCDTVIEPLLKEQWFIDMKPLTKPAIEALEKDQVKFYPASRKQQLIRYLESLRDWNISRQIVWGIQIPAFQNVDEPEDWVFDTRTDQELIEIKGKAYRRDPDVFDTWFSSSSWPYSTLDYPEGEDFHDFYPLSVMETGADILYPWVSRMLMFGLYNVGEIPFEAVYLHGLINDEHGQKMSKSKDNVVNPMDMITKYGSDAFRMGIIADLTPGNNRSFDESKLIAGRNFCNKLWNVARYIEGELGETLQPGAKPEPETAADHWILERLSKATEAANNHLDNYRFSEAYDLLYHVIWDEVADWYIEASKGQQNASVLNYALETSLKLIHPFAPFVTETIWQTLHPDSDTLLITSAWPTAVDYNDKQSWNFEKIKQIVTEIRQIKTLLQLKKCNLYYVKAPFIKENADLICKLARLETVGEVSDGRGLRLTQTSEECWLGIDQASAQTFTSKLSERKAAVDKQISVIKGRLNNDSYIKKAPADLVKQSRKQLKDLETELETIESQLKQFGSLS
jgi:valyl-tRNA synthetase